MNESDIKLLQIVNLVRAHKNLSPVEAILDSERLREDLGFDSLDLAEFTVRVEEFSGVDIFEAGVVRDWKAVRARVGRHLGHDV